MKAIKVEAIVTGGKFCDCGGLMVRINNQLLLSDPPKIRISCPFCGKEESVDSHYNLDINFKKKEK